MPAARPVAAPSRPCRPAARLEPAARAGHPAPGRPAVGFLASGLGVALFSSAVFGLSGSFAKALLETGWTPGAAVTARLTGAALILAIPAIPALRGRWHQLRDNWLTIVLFGLIGVAACQLFYFNAVARLSVGVALLLEYLAPVIIVLWLWAASRKRPRPLTIAGTLLSLGGLVLVLDLTGAVKIDLIGVLWGIAAAVCLAIYFFITAKENDTLPPIVLASGGLLVGAAVMWLAAATGLLPMAFSTADTKLGPWITPWWVSAGRPGGPGDRPGLRLRHHGRTRPRLQGGLLRLADRGAVCRDLGVAAAWRTARCHPARWAGC